MGGGTFWGLGSLLTSAKVCLMLNILNNLKFLCLLAARNFG